MTPQIKNIIMFAGIAAALLFVYFYFIKSEPEDNLLVTDPFLVDPAVPQAATPITEDFLSILLNIKGIKLDDAIFSDPAFLSLRDGSIVLIPDGDEGRPNPFAPLGSSPAPIPGGMQGLLSGQGI